MPLNSPTNLPEDLEWARTQKELLFVSFRKDFRPVYSKIAGLNENLGKEIDAHIATAARHHGLVTQTLREAKEVLERHGPGFAVMVPVERSKPERYTLKGQARDRSTPGGVKDITFRSLYPRLSNPIEVARAFRDRLIADGLLRDVAELDQFDHVLDKLAKKYGGGDQFKKPVSEHLKEALQKMLGEPSEAKADAANLGETLDNLYSVDVVPGATEETALKALEGHPWPIKPGIAIGEIPDSPANARFVSAKGDITPQLWTVEIPDHPDTHYIEARDDQIIVRQRVARNEVNEPWVLKRDTRFGPKIRLADNDRGPAAVSPRGRIFILADEVMTEEEWRAHPRVQEALGIGPEARPAPVA